MSERVKKMNRTAKIWLIVAGILVVLGPILIVCATTINGGFSFAKTAYETNTIEIGSTFDQIAVKTEITDLEIATSDEKQCRVVCAEPEKMKHTAEVKNGTLMIKSSDDRKWNERLFKFSFKDPKVTVYLPESDYKALQIDTHSGDVKIADGLTFDTAAVIGDTCDIKFAASVKNSLQIAATTGDVDLSGGEVKDTEITTSTGDIKINGLKVKGGLSAAASTGDITLNDTIAEGAFSINTTTGDVHFNDCDASEITVKTTTGDVTGTLLSDKVFITDTSTGDVHVPKTGSGGICEITTSTGDIIIDIKAK